MRLALLVTIYAAINVTGLLLLRRGMSDANSLTGAVGEPRAVLGAALYATSFLIFIASLRYYPVTVVVPLFTGTVFSLCSALLAWWILGEHLGPRTIIGIAAVGLRDPDRPQMSGGAGPAAARTGSGSVASASCRARGRSPAPLAPRRT